MLSSGTKLKVEIYNIKYTYKYLLLCHYVVKFVGTPGTYRGI